MGIPGSSGRNLFAIVAFMLLVFLLATIAYMAAGWNFSDSLYMVLLTVYTVGYTEVHPVDTAYLHIVTVATMVFGCTGMIVFTGLLVQFLTVSQLQKVLGVTRMQNALDKLKDHIVLVGFGRIGVQLAQELKTGGAEFVVLEKDEKRALEARGLGYLCLLCDATDEDALRRAGIDRARTLATVLPNDAANVFITLSGRSLNPGIEIIARGELPSTESKLIQAGADRVVLPTHIGAERIAELILFQESAHPDKMKVLEHSLWELGLETDVIIVAEKGALAGFSIAEIEAKVGGGFFVVQINRRDAEPVANPDRSTIVKGGDGLVVVGRNIQTLRTLFVAPVVAGQAAT
ncbi:TrkA family potassium uptake protein [Hyphomonas sp.]|uniref:potassium channel family protein n=1 Tax=Hyphomonas sp. TaxID=87 RepID=UPI003526F63D